VYITIGTAPSSPAANTNSNVSQVSENGGQIYLGTNNVSALPTTTVTADGGIVVFSTGSLQASAITLGGGSQVTSKSTPKTVVLPSLDLTDPVVIHDIQVDQAFGVVGGTILVINDVVQGGSTIVVSPNWLAQTLSGENIPAGVTVTM